MSTLKIERENGKIFCPLADSWHIETPEEKVRQEYIKILVEDYGYSLDQMAQEIKVNNSQRGQGKARADIVIWKSKQDKIESKAAFIVVECKAENVRIREEDYYQGYNYASWAGASFFVTTNEKETKYFNVDKDYLPKELVEVVAIPTAEEALNDKKVKDILSKTKTFTRDDFTKILRTCHNIIRNNDKLSPEAAFDEISKILFMKIKYEREQRGAKVFTKNEFVEKEKWFEKEIRPSLKGTPKDLPYMQFLFYNTKEEFKDDQLFEENEIIKIRQNSFEQILEKLETYNLSDTQDDVKGILIGNNGSGKSNVLEAISGIFVNAYSAKAIHKFVYSLTYDYFLLSCGLLFASIFRIKNMTAWRYTMQSYLNSVFILFSHMARRIIPAMRTSLRQYLERHPSESLCRPAW